MPEQETRPVNKYLPPRPRQEALEDDGPIDLVSLATKDEPKGFWKWLDQTLDRL